jgi:hypothetical protein
LESVAEVHEGLRRERKRLLDAVDALGGRASTVPVTEADGWTTKDVIAHLIHYAGQIAWALGAQIEPPAYVVSETRRLTGQEWNERAVEFWSGSSLDEVRAEFERVVDLVVERVELLTDDDLAARDRVPWAPDRPLWEFIGHDTFLHEWPAHAKQIEDAARS